MKTYIFYVLTIACLMIAQTIFKCAEVIIKREFDWKVFFEGVLKHLLICAGTFLMYLAGALSPDIQIVGETTIIDALNVIAVAVIIKTAVSCIENLKNVYEVNVELGGKSNEEIG